MEVAHITIVGSLVTDFVVWAPRRPRMGETLIGHRFQRFLGGKGFNQAVAAARLGARVKIVGAIGTDEMASHFIKALESEGVDRHGLAVIEGTTGIGLPLVTDEGDVSIVGVPGVNDQITPEHIRNAKSSISDSSVCIVQCEIPSNASATALAMSENALKVLNAAPGGERASQLAPLADIVVVNEPELADLTGVVKNSAKMCVDEIANLATSILNLGNPRLVAVTLGERGALLVERNSAWVIDAHEVAVEDPTGAGDAFTAAFAVGVVAEMNGAELLEFANAAGAVAVQTAGAHPSMPHLEKVKSLLTQPDRPVAKPV